MAGTRDSNTFFKKGSTLDSIADLRNLEGKEDDQTAVVSGYNVPGDVDRTLPFYWDSASLLDDDGGSVVKPTSIDTLDPGRWLRGILSVINVKDFGAVGDGINDDSDAIQEAINYSSLVKVSNPDNINGSKVLFPPGRYKTTKVIILPYGDSGTIHNPTNNVIITGYGATLVGSGSSDTDHPCFESGYWDDGDGLVKSSVGSTPNSRLTYFIGIEGLFFANYTYSLDIYNWNQGCYVRDIYTSRCQCAVRAQHSFYMEVKNVTCRDAPTQDTKPAFIFNSFVNIMPIEGLKSSGHSIVVSVSGADGCTFINCGFENCDYGFYIDGESSLVAVKDSYFESCAVAAIYVTAVGTLRRARIENCFFNVGAAKILLGAIGNSDYANFVFDSCHFNSGDYAVQDNFYVRIKAPMNISLGDQNISENIQDLIGSNVVYDSISSVIDSELTGFNTAALMINKGNTTASKIAGDYSGGFGYNVPNLRRHPFSDLTITGDTWDFDTYIDFDPHLVAVWMLEYDHSVGTYKQNHLLVGNGSTVTVYIFGNTLPVASGVAASNNDGKLRLTVTQHLNKNLARSIARLL